MNILIIGNGFDLAHGLPTKYRDFLEFVKVIRQIGKTESKKELLSSEWKSINQQIKEIIEKNMKYIWNNLPAWRQMWDDLLDDNIWIDYFLQCNMYQKENWIDFESEISNVIQAIDSDIHRMGNVYKLEDTIKNISNCFLDKKYDGVRITYKELRDRLLCDLNKLIRAFEIYLCEYVEKIEIKKISPDIEKLKIDFIISFNYTHTYSKIYGLSERAGKDKKTAFDYIHGEADINNTIKSNNMVLGIDEYLSKKKKDREVEFIAFKKFYQRIYKGTGCEYKEWIDKIKKNKREVEERLGEQCPVHIPFDKCFGKEHYLYIMGHSLDITDRDILRDLILNDNVYTTIFYFDQSDLGAKIANLVKVIGQNELIKRTGGSMKTIEFKQQQDMVERKAK